MSPADTDSRPRLVRLLERERGTPKLPWSEEREEDDWDDDPDADDARRWRCIRVGSTGRFAMRANRESTVNFDTIPERLPVLVGGKVGDETGESSVTNRRWDAAETLSKT